MRTKLFIQYLCTGIGALVLLGLAAAAYIFTMIKLQEVLGDWVSWTPIAAILGGVALAAWGLATDEAKRRKAGGGG